MNSLTSLTPGSAKIPIAFDTDREAVEAMLVSLCQDDAARQARIVRIESTLVLTEMEVSETAWADVSGKPGLEALTAPRELGFGPDGNLPPVASGS